MDLPETVYFFSKLKRFDDLQTWHLEHRREVRWEIPQSGDLGLYAGECLSTYPLPLLYKGEKVGDVELENVRDLATGFGIVHFYYMSHFELCVLDEVFKNKFEFLRSDGRVIGVKWNRPEGST